MSGGLLVVDLAACGLVTLTAGWLVTDRQLSRAARVCCAAIVAGACVNTIGIYGMLAALDGFFYGDVWPSEVLVDVGVASLLLRWAVRLHRAPRESTCP
ncbi:hypothetical protein [Luteibacter yeojuensis]|uniref:Uncharacterized protein n=1 Tax=Luteibacter yeojuensis TaxID=345309 RepID=A0A0F3L159_9GAMM|nr:hypothetical protein [Luteibacter yeojuensis]KJV36084.1 hypothetical protein VI08_06285 [Luteibacter yeojuensis]